MDKNSNKDPLMEMYIFETIQLTEQLERLILSVERSGMDSGHIGEIFRIMHTIKGSSAMMHFTQISDLAHSMEDVFFFLRENRPEELDYSALTDILLGCADFIKTEINKIENGLTPDGSANALQELINDYLQVIHCMFPDESTPGKKESTDHYAGNGKSDDDALNSRLRSYKAVLYFEDGCEMENIRAFAVLHRLKEFADVIRHEPPDITEGDESACRIRETGFEVYFCSELQPDEIKEQLEKTVFLKELVLDCHEEILPLRNENEPQNSAEEMHTERMGRQSRIAERIGEDNENHPSRQSFISVNILKLDRLMDLMGELVISQSMVTQNPELKGLQLDSFHKSARQLGKITNELQDIIMSIRMVPLSATFQKMQRIVRDMSKKLNKEVELEIIGGETEVDKNVIEQISDPLMHLIRNSIDHGIEAADQRIANGKPAAGKIILEAANTGGNVWIYVRDDGKGLNRDKILSRARKENLYGKADSDLTDQEIYSLIMKPGFSTKEQVTEFSGRGVGMDVVAKNIEKVGGTVLIDSSEGQGTAVSIKIPLTLAIVDGMIAKVGKAFYTIPTVSVKESFKAGRDVILPDGAGKEMIMVRGECYPVIRLYQKFGIETQVTEIADGMVVMVENGGKSACIFIDGLVGQQQVVVKPLPGYVKKSGCISGCTLLGDGGISLILDIAGLLG